MHAAPNNDQKRTGALLSNTPAAAEAGIASGRINHADHRRSAPVDKAPSRWTTTRFGLHVRSA